jgi:hypothetical protein
MPILRASQSLTVGLLWGPVAVVVVVAKKQWIHGLAIGEHPSTGFDRNRGAGPLSSLSLQTMVETVLDWVRTWRPMLVRLRAVPRETSSWPCTEHVPWGYLCRCCLRLALTLTLPCVVFCCTGQWATGHYHGLPTCSVAAVVDHLAVCDTESRVVAP